MDHPHLVGSRGPLSSTPASSSPPYTPNNGVVTPTIAHSESGTQVELQPYTGSDTEQEVYSRPFGGSKRPRHIFAKHKKWMIVYMVSLGGAFSALSSNIYFPAIDTISKDLGVSATDVGFTITVYMVVQGIAPSLYGGISDARGRRITFVVALVVYLAANVSLSFTSNLAMLVVLRGLQAAGSAATISISTGVIADIAEPDERAGFVGTNAGIRMIGQAIGPVIGGLLNSAWGFRSIFWFLFVFAPKLEKLSWETIIEPLTYILRKDVLVLLSWGALVYTIWSMVTSSTTTVLLKTFPDLTQWQVGLCFLPNGIGCVIGSVCTGQLMDRAFKRAEARYKQEHGLVNVDVKSCRDFPFERVRLSLLPYFSVIFIVSVGLYGPSYEFNDLRRHFAGNLVASLGLQFIIASTATAIFNINSTILVDYFPDNSAGATATNNLCRCLLGAAGVSVIEPMIAKLKIRNAFLVLTAIAAFFSPLVWVQWKMAEKRRRKRLGA
ncbi:hypothetical protein FPRO06_06215 [Fusarium proliferatum]|nr:hypothetical protein FPRO06_06215 [Fusarium proliferatum]